MSKAKQVKVDNWGIYFLQRLKHFFNRTDYCDLTLQFQDNAQLKVHRLVLNACTEYFEVLERTCEMYEDCLVMPDDLQADVVVPIVNFMYTGQLEFKPELLDRLHLTSMIMNMPVLTKLLDAQKSQQSLQKSLNVNTTPAKSYSFKQKSVYNTTKLVKRSESLTSSTTTGKRSFAKAFGNTIIKDKKFCPLSIKSEKNISNNGYQGIYNKPPTTFETATTSRKVILSEPRPTRYDLPEELEPEGIYSNSFTSISYASEPLMVHPETSKKYMVKRSFSNVSNKLNSREGIAGIVECKKVTRSDALFEDDVNEHINEDDTYEANTFREPVVKDSSQLFDQILDQGPKVMIEIKNNKQIGNIDHAKVISEVLKKYPHLVKSNKNIKLKILDAPSKNKKSSTLVSQAEKNRIKTESPDYTYETEILNSKEAANLIALGAENINGPWICLICGTPGRAVNFTSYYKFRRHLVEVHHEKPLVNMCEYCGFKSQKRNHILHHLYTKHDIPPPPQYRFPKCNMCDYIALTEVLLVKHKLTHSDSKTFRCNVCNKMFNSSSSLLLHIQSTGHKYSAERKTNIKCIYCLKQFSRENNLYTHLKATHKLEAKCDGIIEDSDEDKPNVKVKAEPKQVIGYESDNEDGDMQYQINQGPDGEVHIVSKKLNVSASSKQKILNPGFGVKETKVIKKPTPVQSSQKPQEMYREVVDEDQFEEVILIGDTEYIMRENQLIPIKKDSEEYITSDLIETDTQHSVFSESRGSYTNISNIQNTEVASQPKQSKFIKNPGSNVNQPIQIVVSNEEEYKNLMASNHSIIIDNNDANKTLTVLTAPHSSTAIDLDNTQSNDMMIIQEDYPMSVTQALPTENSNIVVVYSHSVGDTSKPFQIITQDLGPQFVQSSTIYTPNYETVTTNTPVMSTQIKTWQNSATVNANINDVLLKPKLRELTIDQENKNCTVDENINDLPAIELPSQTSLNEEESQKLSEQELSSEKCKSVSVPNLESSMDEVYKKSENNHISGNIITDEKQVDELNHESLQDQIEEGVTHTMDVEDSSEIELNDNNQSNQILEQQTVTESEVIVESTNLKITPEQIQTLTSEWSEEDESSQEKNTEEPVENTSINTLEPAEVDETIENIQQEMANQMISFVQQSVDEKNENISASKPQDSNEISNSPTIVTPNKRISSLLTDWDENDSQQENSADDSESTNIDQQSQIITTGTEKEEDSEVPITESNPKDNLKHLVSDWDDDEEESKE